MASPLAKRPGIRIDASGRRRYWRDLRTLAARFLKVRWPIRDHFRIRPVLVLLLVLPFVLTTVRAADSTETEAPGLWGLQVIGFAQHFPAYPSSSDNNLTVLPIPFPVYRGQFLRFGDSLEDVASGRIVQGDRISLSVDFSASFPEKSRDLARRQGMPDLDFLIEGGPELKISLLEGLSGNRDLDLSLQLRAAVSLDGLDTHSRGFIFSPELEYRVRDWMSHRIGAGNEFRVRMSPKWASSEYADYFFGVADAFATTDRPAYLASSGYLHTEFLLGLNRKITDRLEFRGSLRLWVNNGSANSGSPLFQRDIDTGIRLAFFWTAWESKRRVASPTKKHNAIQSAYGFRARHNRIFSIPAVETQRLDSVNPNF